MAQFYTAPDNTAQAASTYKNNLDNAATVHDRVSGGLQVAAQASPDMTIRYTAGSIQNLTTLTEIATGSSGTIVAPSANPRIDRIVVDNSTGAITVLTGTEDASPTAPAITAGKTVLAQIALATSTTQITNSLITDERPAIALFASNDLADLSITGGTAATTADDADLVPIYDDSAGANRKMTRANLLLSQPVGNIDIAGATDLGAAPADADELMINDGGTNKKLAISDLKAGLGMVLLASATAASDATIDMTMTSGYSMYVMTGTNVIPATDDSDVFIRFQTAGGSFRTGASDYGWSATGRTGTVSVNTNDTADSRIEIWPGADNGVGSSAGESMSFSMDIHDPRGSNKTVTVSSVGGLASDGEPSNYFGSGHVETAEDNDVVRFMFASGNVTSGEFRLFGIL